MTKQLAAPFRSSFEFGTSSLTGCQIDRLYVYFEKTSVGIPVNAFMKLSDAAWTQTFTGPGRIRQLVKIGSDGEAANRDIDGQPWSIKSNTVENWLTVCGMEKVKLNSAVTLPSFDLVGDGSTYKKITNFDAYKSWFELDTSAEGASTKCVIDKYEVVKKDGANYVALGDLEGQTRYKLAELDTLTPESDFIVNMDYTAEETIYLQATSMGGSVARAEIAVKVTPYDCEFEFTPLEASVSLNFEDGKEIKLYE